MAPHGLHKRAHLCLELPEDLADRALQAIRLRADRQVAHGRGAAHAARPTSAGIALRPRDAHLTLPSAEELNDDQELLGLGQAHHHHLAGAQAVPLPQREEQHLGEALPKRVLLNLRPLPLHVKFGQLLLEARDGAGVANEVHGEVRGRPAERAGRLRQRETRLGASHTKLVSARARRRHWPRHRLAEETQAYGALQVVGDGLLGREVDQRGRHSAWKAAAVHDSHEATRSSLPIEGAKLSFETGLRRGGQCQKRKRRSRRACRLAGLGKPTIHAPCRRRTAPYAADRPPRTALAAIAYSPR